MEFEFFGARKTQKQRAVEFALKFFERELNLTSSKLRLAVMTDAGIAQENEVHGSTAAQVFFEGNTGILMYNPRLPFNKILECIAHEMVHVKQHARGQIVRKVSRNGRTVTYWCGRRVDTSRVHYFDLPWEREAYGRERVLFNALIKALSS